MPSTMQLVLVVLLSSSTIMFSQAHPGFGYGFGWPGYNNGGAGGVGGGSGGGGGGGGGDGSGGGGDGGGGSYDSLSPNFYDFSCPQANGIITSVLEEAIAKDPRMAASLLRLHFHDCFVQGCDASLLLDDSSTIKSEKKAKPNAHSLRGFKVIDEIKARLEEACPETVSCADILALAARGSTVLSGGPNWELPLGRRDSLTASLKLATLNIPAPNFTISQLVQSFKHVGLDETDLVALSGAHTIGMARCKSFKQRLYTKNGNQVDVTLARDATFLNELRSVCPSSGGDRNLSPMDYATPRAFDNTYYKLVLGGRGLLFTDEALVAGKVPNIVALVKAYAQDEALFFSHFAKSIVKMGETSPLLGSNGQIRKNCRCLN